MSKRKILSYFEVKEGKPSTRKEKTENKFTREEGSREETDAQLPNSKPRNFQMK